MSDKDSLGRLSWLRSLTGLLLTIALAVLVYWIMKKIYAVSLPFSIPGKVFEYPIWAVLFGIIVNLFLRPFKGNVFIRPAVRIEFFLKTCLVLQGTNINLKLLPTTAGGAALQVLKNWAFTLVFVLMGQGFAFGVVKPKSWKPVTVFPIATLFNMFLTLDVSCVIFS